MSYKKKQSGQSIMEFALILPLSLLLIFGIVDIGTLVINMISLREATQEAALYASVQPTDHSGITARALNATSFPVDITDATVIIQTYDRHHNAGPACAGEGNMIEVTVQKDFTFITPMVSIFMSEDSLTLETKQVELILRPECP
jgi:Flp pilus assembly protein TadG